MSEPYVPHRIQLRRAKGWRMPPNTIKVDRTTPWGNPFVVGRHGTQERCVELFRYLVGGGLLCASSGPPLVEQEAYLNRAVASIGELRGKNLACWCPLGKPCHADVLLAAAAAQREA